MIQTAYVNPANWLTAKLDNGMEISIAYNVQLQGFTSTGVTYKDTDGWIKLWHENGSIESICYAE